MIKLELRQTNITRKSLQNELKANQTTLKQHLPIEEVDEFILKQKTSYKVIMENNRKTYLPKLTKIIQKKRQKLGIILNEDWFINKTNIKLTDDMKWILSLGHKFAIPTDKDNFSTIHTIAEIEQAIQKIDDEREKDMARSKLSTKISMYKRKIKQTEREKYILTIYKDTEKFLKRYKNKIIVTPADKGNKTVVIYKEDYQTKMNNLLEDKNTYKITRNDPTAKLLKINNNIVNELYKTNQIDLKLKLKLHSAAANAPRLYGLPKIHKPDTPLRPISSSVNVPCYALSKHIGSILQNIVSTDHNIKNSIELKERLNNITLNDDEILISLDVISLFTNIPIYLAIKNIMDKWDDIKHNTDINKSKFLQILNFCLRDNNYFNYENDIYIQTFGMPMGNPLSPTIANIILDKLLDECILQLKENDITIKFMVKYVDDIFAIVNKTDTEIILETFNTYHNKLQFTIEKEINNKIPFLDMQIIRQDNTIITDWYKKPTSSGRIINYFSTQPKNQKINTLYNIINKVIDISKFFTGCPAAGNSREFP